MQYLSMAASNSAEVEKLALGAGIKKGGAAKGELVLAMYELANCFRNGWGIKKDPAAAKQYYETAANLGDTDAMNEVAWCYLEGFGTKKDKVCLRFIPCSMRLLSHVGRLYVGFTGQIAPVYKFMQRRTRTVSLGDCIASMTSITREAVSDQTFPRSPASLFGQQSDVRLKRKCADSFCNA